MKELKVILATQHPKMKNACDGAIEVYPKSDVDSVIAELKAQVNGFFNRANLWHYNAQNEHNAAVAVRMENAKLKAKIAEKDKEIAELKEQYKDMDVTHTVHIAKMNARIEELEDNVDLWKKENSKLKRALYKACSNWAMAESYSVLNDVPTANRWIHALRKLKEKLEKYK